MPHLQPCSNLLGNNNLDHLPCCQTQPTSVRCSE
ncbi:hypothetical protein LINPERPRIM_LOCUS22621 [Linum perenne]